MEVRTRETPMRKMLQRWRSNIEKCWRPKKTKDCYRFIVHRIPTWVQLFGLPSECLTEAAGTILGQAVGEVIEVDTREDSQLETEGLRIRVWLNPSRPLVIGFYLQYQDGSLKWIQCSYEKSYDFCTNCWCAGHKSPQCDIPLEEAQRGIDYFLNDLYDRLDSLILPESSPVEVSTPRGAAIPDRLSVQSLENEYAEFLEEWRHRLRAAARQEVEAEQFRRHTMSEQLLESGNAEEEGLVVDHQQEEISALVGFQHEEQSSDEETDCSWGHWEPYEHNGTS